MPGSGGWTTARAIFAFDGRSSTLPILAFGADASVTAVHDASLRLFDGTVAKPILVIPLLASLRNAAAWEPARKSARRLVPSADHERWIRNPPSSQLSAYVRAG